MGEVTYCQVALVLWVVSTAHTVTRRIHDNRHRRVGPPLPLPVPNEGYPRAWDMSVPLSGGNRAHLACEERVARNSCSVCQVALSPYGPPPQDLGGVWLWKRVGFRPPSPGPAGWWRGVAPAPPFEWCPVEFALVWLTRAESPFRVG